MCWKLQNAGKIFKDLNENEGIYYIHGLNSILWRCQLSLNWPYISSNSNQILEGYFNTNLQVEFKMNIKRQIDTGKTYIYSQLSFDTCAKDTCAFDTCAFQWRKESLFNNWYFDNWKSTCKKKNTKLWLTFHIFTKNSKQIIDWNVKQKQKNFVISGKIA